MLLVDDEQAQPVERREDRRPRADHQVHLAAPDAVPLIVALAVGQPAVLDGHAIAEGRPELRGDLRRERNLRHQDQHTPALRDGVTRQAHVELGLAAAGDAVHQRGVVAAAVEQSRQRRQRRRLLVGQRTRLVAIDDRRRAAGKRIALAHLLVQVHEPTRREPPQRAQVDTVLSKRANGLRLAAGCQRRQRRLLTGAERGIWRDAPARRRG